MTNVKLLGQAAYRLFMRAWVLDPTRPQALWHRHVSVHMQASKRDARQQSITSARTGCDRAAIGFVAPIAADPTIQKKRKAV